jgi:hypothetical protein
MSRRFAFDGSRPANGGSRDKVLLAGIRRAEEFGARQEEVKACSEYRR